MFFKKVATIAMSALLSTLVLNQAAQAKELRIIQQLKKSAPLLAKKNAKKKISPVCANFTGNWIGICVESDGHQESEEVIIDQYQCESIAMDGGYFNINGLTTISNSSSPNSEWPFSAGVAISYIWNDAQTRLYGSAGFSFAGLFSGVSTQETWLEGDTLRRKDTAAYSLDPTGVPSPIQLAMVDCTFTRR
jgi:hypothetical protein